MKRFLLFLIICKVLLGTPQIKANELYGIYGIKDHVNIEDFKKYIGQTVVYYPQLHSNIARFGETFTGKSNIEYTITNIKRTSKRLKVQLIEKNGKSKAIMEVGLKNKTSFRAVPLVLVEKLAHDKAREIGKMFQEYPVGEKFECVDLYLDSKPPNKESDTKDYPTIYYKLRNIKNSEILEIPLLKAQSGNSFLTLKKVNENER